MPNTIIKKGLCGMCRSQCAIEATITDGKITSLKPDPDSPRGRLCPRGQLAPAVIYGKKRLLKPLIRTGDKGSGQFREASWEEALDYAANAFLRIRDQYGPRALASYFGQGVLENTISKAGRNFFSHLGSPNSMSCGSICNVASAAMGPTLALGFDRTATVADIENSEIVVSWGKNSKTDDGPYNTFAKIRKMQSRGGKLIVIDPRKEGMGSYADLWVPVTPRQRRRAGHGHAEAHRGRKTL